MGRLFIAEKPSMGRALAEVLGSPKPSEGHIRCAGGDIVTWCFGHLLEQAEPEAYDPDYKSWNMSHLPIIPASWKMGVRKDARAQVKVIKGLLKECDSVVNFGDPEREGQLIVDELLEHLSWKGRTLRLWLNSADEKSVRKALAEMKDNSNYRDLSQSALARSRADWVVGMNLTRAMTLTARSQGVISGGVLSVGRVQTPVLAIVVGRDCEIENFTPKAYFVPYIMAVHAKGTFKALWVAGDESAGMDDENRLVDEAVARQIVAKATGKSGVVAEAKSEEKKENPPLPHTLASLQAAADKKLGLSAQQTLNIAQALYEKKISSYPRTDCAYLKEEQFDDAPGILMMLAKHDCPGASGANPGIKSPAWNSAKVDAHHGIIPTGEQPRGLSREEAAVFSLIAEGYVRQFYNPYRYMTHTVIVSLAEERWKGQGQSVVDLGWRSVAGDNERCEALPQGIRQGDPVAAEAAYDSLMTKPPARFTEGTLLQAMENVHRYVQDQKLKKLLRDAKGIGTSATQSSIIETLKTRHFLVKKGKQLMSTDTGRMLIDAVPSPIKDPGTTALWEMILNAMAAGKVPLADFMLEQERLVRQHLAAIASVSLPGRISLPPCPECGEPLDLRSNKRGKYWSCFNKGKHKLGEPLFWDDDGGKPVQRSASSGTGAGESAQAFPCPECGGPLRRIESRKKQGFFFWGCKENGHPLLQDEGGVPGKPMTFDSPEKGKGRRKR